MERLIPLKNLILLRPDEVDRKVGKLELTDAYLPPPTKATVVEVGLGMYNDAGTQKIPMDVKVGDRVYIPPHGGREIELNGEKLLIFSDMEIYGIIKDIEE